MDEGIAIKALRQILATRPASGLNPDALMSDPDDVKVCWNVHLIARRALEQIDAENRL